jgi:hypothetical protein
MYLIGVSELLSFSAKLTIFAATVKLVINGHRLDNRKLAA